MKICSVEDCSDPHQARGWCSKHYERWRQHGDPTVVLPPWVGGSRFVNDPTTPPHSRAECPRWTTGGCPHFTAEHLAAIERSEHYLLWHPEERRSTTEVIPQASIGAKEKAPAPSDRPGAGAEPQGGPPMSDLTRTPLVGAT